MKYTLLRLGSIAAVLAGFAGSACAQSTVMLSNLAQSSSNYFSTSDAKVFSSNINSGFASSFTTGPVASVLDNVTLAIVGGSGSGFSLALYSDSAGSPGTLINILSGSSSPITAGQYAYTPGGSTGLSADTTYWIVSSVPVSSRASFTSSVTNF